MREHASDVITEIVKNKRSHFRGAQLAVFQHFQWEPEENNGMNQCIDTVTPEHLKDRDRKTQELRKERDTFAF